MEDKPTLTQFIKILAEYGAASFNAGYTETAGMRNAHRRYRKEARRLKWELEKMWEAMK